MQRTQRVSIRLIYLPALLLGVGLWLAGSPSGQADVTSPAQSLFARSGLPIFFPLDIDADTPVAGINGQIDFDPNIFENPQIGVGVGSLNFIARGNLVTPGQFRFVLYANPTSVVNLNQTIVWFRVDVKEEVGPETETVVNYSLEAASTADGTSFATLGQTVQFSSVSFLVNRSGLADWERYR